MVRLSLRRWPPPLREQWASSHGLPQGKEIMLDINFLQAGRLLPIRKVHQLRLTSRPKSSTLNGEAIASAVASTLKGAVGFVPRPPARKRNYAQHKLSPSRSPPTD